MFNSNTDYENTITRERFEQLLDGAPRLNLDREWLAEFILSSGVEIVESYCFFCNERLTPHSHSVTQSSES